MLPFLGLVRQVLHRAVPCCTRSLAGNETQGLCLPQALLALTTVAHIPTPAWANLGPRCPSIQGSMHWMPNSLCSLPLCQHLKVI